MFGLFKKKTELELLDAKYKKCMKEAFELSSSNRSESDKQYKEADEIAKQLEQLKNN